MEMGTSWADSVRRWAETTTSSRPAAFASDAISAADTLETLNIEATMPNVEVTMNFNRPVIVPPRVVGHQKRGPDLDRHHWTFHGSIILPWKILVDERRVKRSQGLRPRCTGSTTCTVRSHWTRLSLVRTAGI